jgi:hypothetical protein
MDGWIRKVDICSVDSSPASGTRNPPRLQAADLSAKETERLCSVSMKGAQPFVLVLVLGLVAPTARARNGRVCSGLNAAVSMELMAFASE